MNITPLKLNKFKRDKLKLYNNKYVNNFIDFGVKGNRFHNNYYIT